MAFSIDWSSQNVFRKEFEEFHSHLDALRAHNAFRSPRTSSFLVETSLGPC